MIQTPSPERLQRAEHKCEFCGEPSGLILLDVSDAPAHLLSTVVTCGMCADQISTVGELDVKHWFCLNEAIWSEVPAVQVMAYRLLIRMGHESWAADLLDSLYLDEAILSWAKANLTHDAAHTQRTLDCNGTPLADGDSITLIKGLDVKGANFTAKRGTLVKSIRLGDDPELIEGRVNGVAVFLKTCFIKKSS
jgi:protein PhnA